MNVSEYQLKKKNEESMIFIFKNSLNSAVGLFQTVMGGQNDCVCKARCHPGRPPQSREKKSKA